MDRIDSPGATVDNKFTEGSPTGGVPATVVSATWLNDVQEEIIAVMTSAGISPLPGVQDQLLSALQYLLQHPTGGGSGTNYVDLGVAYGNITLQWGVFGSQLSPGANGVATLPVAFTTTFLRAIAFYDSSDTALQSTFNAHKLSLTQIKVSNSHATNGATPSWLAIGI